MLELRLGSASLQADLSGAIFWPDQATLIVADLHFEKASSRAARGELLPPLDTAATLAALGTVIRRHRPERIICLGDSFHDGGAVARMHPADRQTLGEYIASHDWNWIAGNHDPEAGHSLGGQLHDDLRIANICFRHQAEPGETGAELSGHFHPKARIATGPRRVSRPCFVEDGRKLILPAFGAFTGGLDVTDPAIRGLFPKAPTAHLLGRDQLYSFPVA